jgi:putative phosphoribosyl transferase
MKHPPISESELVDIPAGSVSLKGDLVIPSRANGVVLFAHGSGSGRHSPRNQFVAEELQAAGLATLLIDLLTSEEEAAEQHTGHLRFDIGFLAERLIAATRWLNDHAPTRPLGLGYFGASTGAGAALVAAADDPTRVQAIVSRGGRPDLAGGALARVRAPTLLIVGGHDLTVLDLNRAAMARMQADTRLEIVPRAGHLFEEPGALQAVGRLASDWFVRYLDRPHQTG